MTNSTTNDEEVQPKSSLDKKEDFEERYYKVIIQIFIIFSTLMYLYFRITWY